MMPYIVKIPQFEGPLDELLTLAQQGSVDLREIPLARIAEAYLAGTEHHVDLEEATEVLWMLAAMIEMKSRLLVPKPDIPAEPLPLPLCRRYVGPEHRNALQRNPLAPLETSGLCGEDSDRGQVQVANRKRAGNPAKRSNPQRAGDVGCTVPKASAHAFCFSA